jgi:hypothetical protein
MHAPAGEATAPFIIPRNCPSQAIAPAGRPDQPQPSRRRAGALPTDAARLEIPRGRTGRAGTWFVLAWFGLPLLLVLVSMLLDLPGRIDMLH